MSRVLKTVLHFLGDADMSSILRMPDLLRKMLLSAAPSTGSCSTDHQIIKRIPPMAQEQEGAACQLAGLRSVQDHCPGKTVHRAPEDSGQGEPEKAEDPEEKNIRGGAPM